MKEIRGSEYLHHYREFALEDGTIGLVGIKRVQGAMTVERAEELAQQLSDRLESYGAAVARPEHEVFV